MPQGPYPMYQPVYQPPHRAVGDMMKPLVSDFVLAVVVTVGLFLMWLGSLIWGTADSRNGLDLGGAFKGFGALLLTGALIVGAMVRHDIDKWVRAAMIFSAALVIILVGFWTTNWADMFL